VTEESVIIHTRKLTNVPTSDHNNSATFTPIGGPPGRRVCVECMSRTGRAYTDCGVAGAGFTIYGLYLLIFFHGGSYHIFFYVFILPILLIVRFFRERSAYQARQQAAAAQRAPPAR
jgi:hypothetical protein